MFKQYKRKGTAEARELNDGEGLEQLRAANVSVSAEDAAAFGTVPGGMVFRNPANHSDQWYVARAWFEHIYTEA